SMANKQHFMEKHMEELVQKIREPIKLADALFGKKHINKEMYEKIKVKDTKPDKNREIYGCLNTEKHCVFTYNWLKKNEKDVIKELEKRDSDAKATNMENTEKFLKRHKEEIIQKLRNPIASADTLLSKECISREMYKRIKSKSTRQDKTREMFDCLTNEKHFDCTYVWLKENEPDLFKELENHGKKAKAASKKAANPINQDETDCLEKMEYTEFFLTRNMEEIIQKIRNPIQLADKLLAKECINEEMYMRIKSKTTEQDQTREILDCLTKKKHFDCTYDWLEENEPDLFKELKTPASSLMEDGMDCDY
ncbi:biorientation of chromosomes in cell division protein 1-like 1, partial [Clarias magur]